MNSAPSNDKDRQILFVIGMHRSATSAFAGCLGILGAAMPARMPEANIFNPRGYFEPENALEANDQFLAGMGRRWNDCRPIAQPEQDTRRAAEEECARLLSTEFGPDWLVALKDPRVSLLAPIWEAAAEQIGASSCFVVMLRNPVACAASIMRRDGLEGEAALALWLRYMFDAERHSRGKRRTIVAAERFVQDPVSALVDVAEHLGLAWPTDPAVARRDLAELIDTGLLHVPDQILHPLVEFANDVHGCLDQLARCAHGEDAEAVHARLDALGAEFDAMCAGIHERMVFDQLGKAVILKWRHDNAQRTFETANRKLAEQDEKLAQRDEKLAAQEIQLLENDEKLAQRDEKLAAQEIQLLENKEIAKRLNQQVDAVIDVAYWVADKAARAERRAFSTLLRRLGYGVVKGLSAAPVLEGSALGQTLKKAAAKHSPKRFRAKVNAELRARLPADLTTEQSALPAVPHATDIVKTPSPTPPEPAARVIAFYLPQYHPIPENDRWWGKGFTEWTNVVRAKPQFPGHYQPHLPGELGFYDLRVPEIQHRQAELARLHGVEGFCYYLYWFGGTTLLERPLRQMLGDPTLDMPFCLCWANENWTRRWDGLERDILIEQNHSAEDDLAFIAHVAEYLRDPRYIRVEGRPMLVVYRPKLLPDMKKTAQRWRDWCRAEGIGEIHLCMTASFENTDPEQYGLDAIIEFPPNNARPIDITSTMEPYDPDYSGRVYDWTVFPERAKTYPVPAYRTYRGVCTSWDNTARRANGATYFHGATPRGFREWLARAMKETRDRFNDPSSRLVFVNAWNEWAEGAHLEPDAHYGYAWLVAVRDAHADVLGGAELITNSSMPPVAVVVHDGHRHGAQILAVHLVQTLARDLGREVHVVMLADGVLEEDFARLGTLHRIRKDIAADDAMGAVAEALKRAGVGLAIVNSLASGAMAEPLAKAGIRVHALVHEMPKLIEDYGLGPTAERVARHADRIVFPAQIVADGFEKIAPVPPEKRVIQPQGLYRERAPTDTDRRADIRRRVRERWNIGHDALVFIAAGFGDHRKGIDLFVDVALETCEEDPKAVFVWLGVLNQDYAKRLPERVAAEGLSDRILFPGFVDDVTDALIAADVFVLSSREDPFPTVVPEAMDAGLPVVAIAGTGGCADLIAEGFGTLAAAPTAPALAAAIDELRDADTRDRLGAAGRALIEERFSFRSYTMDIVSDWGRAAPRVSVIVPNYNYARYLPDRLRSILEQDWQIYELIVLDDASTDGSGDWLAAELPALFPEARLIRNETNSGSVFAQWRKGVAAARGDLVWIAEADDGSDPEFLGRMVAAFADPEVVLAYTQSRAVDEDGTVVMADYRSYTDDISATKWQTSHVEPGKTTLAQNFAVKNVIPNVSAVVFRRDRLAVALEALAEELSNWKVAGDWRIYVDVLARGGKVAFDAAPLNVHRRHRTSVTQALQRERHFKEISDMQKRVADLVMVDDAQQASAAAYLEQVSATLGLSGTTTKGMATAGSWRITAKE